MRILAGVLEPTSGSVSLDGRDVLAEPEALWSVLGYLPQDFGFFPHLTGQAMLEYLLELKGVASGKETRTLAASLLERVNLAYAAKRKVKEYSGGMRQRLGIAQAVAGDPRLIIVDEPTAGLDPEERHRFYRILAELAEHRTVLLSTHIVEDVAVLCPRFAVIRNGQVVAETSPTEARRMPIEVAAVQGERFPSDSTKKAKTAQPYQAMPDSLTLGSKEKGRVSIRTSFKPERVVVDPNVHVLQLRRQSAEAKL